MDIYELSSAISSFFFLLLWLPYIHRIIKSKNAKSQSLSHLIFLYLGFICNLIYSSSFKVKYTFYTYVLDIIFLTITLIYKFFGGEKVELKNEEIEIKIDKSDNYEIN